MKKSIAVIGEGLTEKYYIESLKGLSPFTLLPRELNRKASSLQKLEQYIKDASSKGFDEVYCLIDLDSKKSDKEIIQYNKIKEKYHDQIIHIKSKGVRCKVVFIESERCTELWFLYYFLKSDTSRKFNSSDEVEKELRKFRPDYEKTEKYFKSVKSLHLNFISKTPQGSLKNAVDRSLKSCEKRENGERNHTFSEFHKFIDALGIKY